MKGAHPAPTFIKPSEWEAGYPGRREHGEHTHPRCPQGLEQWVLHGVGAFAEELFVHCPHTEGKGGSPQQLLAHHQALQHSQPQLFKCKPDRENEELKTAKPKAA